MPKRSIFLSALMAMTLFIPAGEIAVYLEDGTNGGDGKADVVNLVLPAKGMEVLATVPNAEGAFKMTFDGELGQGVLLQAIKNGVFHTQARVNPDAVNRVTVYETSPDAKVTVSMGYVGVYAYSDQVELMTFYYLDNVHTPPTTQSGGGPAFSFKVPPGYTNLEGSIQRGTMPLRQGIMVEDGIGNVTFAVKPGRTSFVARATFGQTNTLTIPLLEDTTEGKLVILPTTMKAEAPGLSFLETDQQNGMNIYQFSVTEGQTELVVNLTGKPDDRRGGVNEGAQARGNDTASGAASTAHTQNPVNNTPNRLNRFRYWIMGSLLALLALMSVVALRR